MLQVNDEVAFHQFGEIEQLVDLRALGEGAGVPVRGAAPAGDRRARSR
jgi:hypothetical protein